MNTTIQSPIETQFADVQDLPTAEEADNYLRTEAAPAVHQPAETAPAAETDEMKMLFKWLAIFWVITTLGVVLVYAMTISYTIP